MIEDNNSDGQSPLKQHLFAYLKTTQTSMYHNATYLTTYKLVFSARDKSAVYVCLVSVSKFVLQYKLRNIACLPLILFFLI